MSALYKMVNGKWVPQPITITKGGLVPRITAQTVEWIPQNPIPDQMPPNPIPPVPPPPSLRYECDGHGNCVESVSGTYRTLEECQAACVTWDCDGHGNCTPVIGSGGEFTSEDDCHAACAWTAIFTGNAENNWTIVGSDYKAVNGDVYVENPEAVTYILCDDNGVEGSFNLASCSALTGFSCQYNSSLAGTLDLSGCTSLIEVYVDQCSFTNMDISGLHLAQVYANNCSLRAVTTTGSSFDISVCSTFTFANNQLEDTAINDLFSGLNSTVTNATIDVSGNPGSATCDPSIATGKGYIVVT